MGSETSSLLPSVTILGLVALVALHLTVSRRWAAGDGARRRSAVGVAALAVLAQAGHFGEELGTGFQERFPAVFGLPPMSLGFFVTFNVSWLVIWSLSLWGLAARLRIALFPLWFLAIGCTLNGVAHPLLSVRAGDYFPGLATSPVVGVLGALLLRRLSDITSSSASPD